MKIDIKKHLIVAMDFPSAADAFNIAEELKGSVDYLKIGKQLFTAEGPSLVRQLKDEGFKIFLDLKFHDIPNTVASAGVEVMKLGVDMFNVHVSGGSEMMKTTAARLAEEAGVTGKSTPKIIGVTVLTSLNDDNLKELGYTGRVDEQVKLFAQLAKKSDLNGVVASAREIELIREACGPEFLIVTPGIRPKWAAKDDQKRVVTPLDAIKKGADYIVVGRAITKSHNRKEAVERLLED